MLKKVLASALVLSSLALVACSTSASKSSEDTVTEWERVQEAGVLKVATPGTLYPTSYYNDEKELVGYEIEMLKEIGERLDLEIEFQEIGVAEAFTSVDSGKWTSLSITWILLRSAWRNTTCLFLTNTLSVG